MNEQQEPEWFQELRKKAKPHWLELLQNPGGATILIKELPEALKPELVAEFCRAFKNKESVNTTEQTKEVNLLEFKKKQDAMEEEIGKMMGEKKCSYKEAYELVAKEKK